MEPLILKLSLQFQMMSRANDNSNWFREIKSLLSIETQLNVRSKLKLQLQFFVDKSRNCNCKCSY